MAQWFYASGGSQMGPVDRAELKRLAAQGALQPTSLVWRDGLAEWVQASKIKGLFGGGGVGDAAGGTMAAGESPVASLAAAPAAAPAGRHYDQNAGASSPAQVISYQGGGGTPVGVTARTVDVLRGTRPWVMFFGVLGFIAAGLYALGGIFVTLLGITGGRSAFPAVAGLLYVAVAAIFFFPALYLWRYGSRISGLLVRGGVQDLESALEAQKDYWRVTGIITVAGIVIVVVVMVFAMLAASRF